MAILEDNAQHWLEPEGAAAAQPRLPIADDHPSAQDGRRPAVAGGAVLLVIFSMVALLYCELHGLHDVQAVFSASLCPGQLPLRPIPGFCQHLRHTLTGL